MLEPESKHFIHPSIHPWFMNIAYIITLETLIKWHIGTRIKTIHPSIHPWTGFVCSLYNHTCFVFTHCSKQPVSHCLMFPFIVICLLHDSSVGHEDNIVYCNLTHSLFTLSCSHSASDNLFCSKSPPSRCEAFLKTEALHIKFISSDWFVRSQASSLMTSLMNIQTAFLAQCPVLAVTPSLLRMKGQSQVV